jgi:hypothetical protein
MNDKTLTLRGLIEAVKSVAQIAGPNLEIETNVVTLDILGDHPGATELRINAVVRHPTSVCGCTETWTGGAIPDPVVEKFNEPSQLEFDFDNQPGA